MGKKSPTPPPQETSTLDIPPPPPAAIASLHIPSRADSTGVKDPDIKRALDEIGKRQDATSEDIKNMTPGSMAFGLMRNFPREKWNVPLTEQGHWPRGSSIAEIKKNPELMKLTPAKAMLKLFEMDDDLKEKGSFKRTK